MSNQTDNRGGALEGPAQQASTTGTVIDPVCGMEISREDAVGSYVYKGQEYFFCNPSCLENFRANPSQYLSPGQAVARLRRRGERRSPRAESRSALRCGCERHLYLPNGS